MSESQFSQGTWRVASHRELCDDPDYIVLGADNTGLCIIGRYDGMSVDRRWGNAHAITAMPDLRAALLEVLNAYVPGWDQAEHSDIGGSVMHARAALAKAEGRS